MTEGWVEPAFQGVREVVSCGYRRAYMCGRFNRPKQVYGVGIGKDDTRSCAQRSVSLDLLYTRTSTSMDSLGNELVHHMNVIHSSLLPNSMHKF